MPWFYGSIWRRFCRCRIRGSPKTKVFRSRLSTTQAHSRRPCRRLSRTIQIVKKEQSEFKGRFLSRDAYRLASQLRIQPATARAR